MFVLYKSSVKVKTLSIMLQPNAITILLLYFLHDFLKSIFLLF